MGILIDLVLINKKYVVVFLCHGWSVIDTVFSVQQIVPEVAEPAPVPKGPLPVEHQMLQEVFDGLAQRCESASRNPQMHRKLEDVHRKLEHLYDCLREGVVSLKKSNKVIIL